MVNHRAKQSEIWDSGIVYGVLSATSGPKTKFHARIHAWQFWKSACISETAACRAKISSILTPFGRKRAYDVQILELWPIAKFHVQIWQFCKSVYISETAACRAKISSISTPWERKRVYVQLLELLPVAKYHAQIWQFWKWACSSETAVCSAKRELHFDPMGQKENMGNFWNFCQWASFMHEYGNFENRPACHWTQVLCWYLWSFSVQSHFRIIWCTCVHRENRSEIWKSGVNTVNMCVGYLWPSSVQSHFGVLIWQWKRWT